MADHDRYGKDVIRSAAGSSFESSGLSFEVPLGTGMPARIDGTVAGLIAVEIESRTSKQVRGAVLDLICHPFPKKLLVLLPVHMQNPGTTRLQCEYLFGRFLATQDFRVVLLLGSAFAPRPSEDTIIIARAISELGFRGA